MGLEVDLRQAKSDLHRMTVRAVNAEKQLDQLKAELVEHKQFWKRDVDEYRHRAEVAEAVAVLAAGSVEVPEP